MNGDKVGTVAAPLPAQFDVFGNNGGPTDTWSLLPNSPAIDMGNDDLAPATDQRGYLRSGFSDSGAFEFNGTVPVLKILSITRPLNGPVTLLGSGVINSVHTIQISSDLISGFGNSGTVTSDVNGLFQYDDGEAGELTKRFYRVTFP